METRTGKTVLLVEDEAIIAMNEAAILQRHGYCVLQAYHGEDAIRKVDDNPVDLILMDIDLGANRMSGTQAARQILENHTLPIVFLTSHTEKRVVDLVKDITRYGYVVKNSGEFVLLESIAMAFELFDSHQRLKESEDRYRTAFITSPDAINLNRMDGLYVDVNEGFTALTGYTREDVIGINSSEIKIWAIPEDRERLIQGLKAHGYVENLESTFRLKNGDLLQGLMSARVLTINGQPHILSITRDISERKEMERHLKESELLYRTIVQTNFDAFMHIDSDGRIRDVNDASCFLNAH